MKLTTLLFTLPFALSASPFDGTWKTNCVAEGAINTRYTVQMENGTGTVEQTQYKDNQCITPTILSRANGPVSFPELDAHTHFDLTYAAFTVTLKDAATVKVANFVEYCGISDWKLDVPTDVSGKTCGEEVSFPKVGDRHYNIIGLNEKGELLLGLITKELNGTAPDKRPIQLDEAFPFVKQ